MYSLRMRGVLVWINDAGRIHIWSEQEHEIIPPASSKGDCLEMAEFLFGKISCLTAILTFYNLQRFSVTGTCCCTEVFHIHVRLFRGAMDSQFLFMGDNATPRRIVAVGGLLDSENIHLMDWLVKSLDLYLPKHMWDILGRCLAARQQITSMIPELWLTLNGPRTLDAHW